MFTGVSVQHTCTMQCIHSMNERMAMHVSDVHIVV
jgi:hypothetical protein